MSCLISSNNYSALIGVNACKYSLGGIKKVWIANYDVAIKNTTSIVNNQIDNITTVVQWLPLELSRTTTKVNEKHLPNGNFEQTLEIEINRMQPNRKLTIESLIKGKWCIIYLDMNDYYWFLGFEKGLVKQDYTATTEVFKGVNSYRFIFRSEQSESVIGVNPDYIESSVDVNLPCSLLDGELALSNDFYIWQFPECIAIPE